MNLEIGLDLWPIDKLVPYEKNPRKNDAAVDRMCASIEEFGFKIPCLVRSDGEVVDGHLRLKAAQKLGITEVPVILCDEWTPAQVKAFRLMVNRSVAWADWDEELLAQELKDIEESGFDLALTGFDSKEIDDLLASLDGADESDEVPPPPAVPASRAGDLWLCGPHRVLCGDSTEPDAVARLLGDRKPLLMVTDPPYGIELDSEWRDRAGLNGCGPAEASYMKHRTEGHHETTISGDTRADWSEAFELVPSLQVAYVWHASIFTREVLDGLVRIGFLYPQQIIWNKGRTVLTRTHYWYQHEPCWYVRKKNAPWFGKAGENSTIWDSASPKFIMGGSDEEKFDHPTQKPVELMRRPILNHTRRGELVYEPFLGSGTTLAAAESTERVCYGMELDPKYVDVVVQRWQAHDGEEGDARRRRANVRRDQYGARAGGSMNRALPPRDRGHRASVAFGQSGLAGVVSRAGGLVGGIENSAETRKAAGSESGGVKRSCVDSGFDGVDSLVAHLLTGDHQPVFLGQRATRAQHGPRCVLLPTHRGHDLFQRGAAFAFEHFDHSAGLAFLARGFGSLPAHGRFLLPGGLLGRGGFRGRDVGRLFANVGLRCVGWHFGLTFLLHVLGSFYFESGRLLSRFGCRRRRSFRFFDLEGFGYRGRRLIGQSVHLAKGLDRFPDTGYRALAVRELLDARVSRNAVPDLDEPSRGPVRGNCRQLVHGAEVLRIRYRLGFLRLGVNGEIVVAVDSKDRHGGSPCAAFAGAITFITRVRTTSKQIVEEFHRNLRNGDRMKVEAPR